MCHGPTTDETRLTRRHLTGACECCSSSYALFRSLIIYKRRLRTPGLQIDHVREGCKSGDLYEDACLILHQCQGAKEYGIHVLPQSLPPISALCSCLHWGTKFGRTCICRAWPVNTHWLSQIVPILCTKRRRRSNTKNSVPPKGETLCFLQAGNDCSPADVRCLVIKSSSCSSSSSSKRHRARQQTGAARQELSTAETPPLGR